MNFRSIVQSLYSGKLWSDCTFIDKVLEPMGLRYGIDAYILEKCLQSSLFPC